MILALEASGSPGTIALVEGGEVHWETTFPTGAHHGGALFAALEEAWNRVAQVTEIRLGLGPGSYAGARMAVAAATGLALPRGIPVLGLPSVCTFSGLDRFCVIGDARRGGFYFTAVEHGIATEGPKVADAPGLHALLAEHRDWPVFTADALPAFAQAQPASPSAVRLATVPLESAPRALEPIYLREPHITRPKSPGTAGIPAGSAPTS